MQPARLINSLINSEGSERSNGFGWGSTAEDVVKGRNLAGKNFVVTGANTGIGFETARVLALAGASSVVLACRNLELGSAAVDRIKEQLPSKSTTDVRVLQCDLGSKDSIKAFAVLYKMLKLPLHVLICNAGVMACPYAETKDGFEMQFGTNHLGHFLLVHELMEPLKAAEGARVVVLSSAGHRISPVLFDDLSGKDTWYNSFGGSWKAYGQSKTANILFAVELNRRMREQGTPITANALHPGGIATDLGRHLKVGVSGLLMKAIFAFSNVFLLKTIPQGAATSVYCATAADAAEDGRCGRYYSDSNVAKPMAHATDPEAAKKLWKVSEEMLGIAAE